MEVSLPTKKLGLQARSLGDNSASRHTEQIGGKEGERPHSWVEVTRGRSCSSFEEQVLLSYFILFYFLSLREITGTVDSGEGSAKGGNNEQLQLSQNFLQLELKYLLRGRDCFMQQVGWYTSRGTQDPMTAPGMAKNGQKNPESGRMETFSCTFWGVTSSLARSNWAIKLGLESTEEGDYFSLGKSGKATLWESCLFWVLEDDISLYEANEGVGDILDTETAIAKALRCEKAGCVWKK